MEYEIKKRFLMIWFSTVFTDTTDEAYQLRKDPRLSENLQHRLGQHQLISDPKCASVDDFLRTCLTDIVGENDTKRLMNSALDIHFLAKYLENYCEQGTEIGTCYKSAMDKRIECVKESGDVVDEELLREGVELVYGLFNVKCDANSEQKAGFIKIS